MEMKRGFENGRMSAQGRGGVWCVLSHGTRRIWQTQREEESRTIPPGEDHPIIASRLAFVGSGGKQVPPLSSSDDCVRSQEGEPADLARYMAAAVLLHPTPKTVIMESELCNNMPFTLWAGKRLYWFLDNSKWPIDWTERPFKINLNSVLLLSSFKPTLAPSSCSSLIPYAA